MNGGKCTIAPQGEMAEGQPTIVGVYVRPSERGQGYGTALIAAAVRRCLARGFDRIRVDVMSGASKRVIEKLPVDLSAHLNVINSTGT